MDCTMLHAGPDSSSLLMNAPRVCSAAMRLHFDDSLPELMS